MRNIELYNVSKDTRNGITGYWVSTRDIYSGQAGTIFLHEYTNKHDLIASLRRIGIVCPHRAYRNDDRRPKR